MTRKITLPVADFDTIITTKVAIGDVTCVLQSATDDDNVDLVDGLYGFTIDNGLSEKEYFYGTLTGSTKTVSAIKSVSRQGTETTGFAREHSRGSSVIITDFATIMKLAKALRGDVALDSTNPIKYDAEPTLTDDNELATKKYVDEVNPDGYAGTNRVILAGNAGQDVLAGEAVYFKTTDQEWYKADADESYTGVIIGIAQGSGTDGNLITGGVLIEGLDENQTGLTAGSNYFVSAVAGALTSTEPANSYFVGVAKSTTAIILPPRDITTPKQFVATSAGVADAGKGVKLNPNGILDETFFSAKKAVRVTLSADYQLPAVSVNYPIVWDTETFDTDDFHGATGESDISSQTTIDTFETSSATTTWFADSFVVGASNVLLKKASIQFVSSDGSSVSCRLHLRSSLTGSNLATSETLATTTTSFANIKTFSFSPYVLTASTTYYIVVEVVSLGGASMPVGTNSAGTTGQVSTNSGVAWSAIAGGESLYLVVITDDRLYFKVPASSNGKYLIIFNLASGTGSDKTLGIRINNTVGAEHQIEGTSIDIGSSISTIYSLAVGDIVTAYTKTSSSASDDVSAIGSSFEMIKF